MNVCDKTLGERLSELMGKHNLTQQELADKISVSRGYVDKWIHNARCVPSDDLKKICETFNVDADYLLFGVPVRNKNVVGELGLNSASIDFLRLLASSKDGSPVPVGWSDGWTKEEEVLVTSHDFDNNNDVEAVYPDEILETVNVLLGSLLGTKLLSLIYKYLRTDFSSGVVRVPDDDFTEVVSVTDEAQFNTKDGRKTIIPFSILRYALGQAILDTLDNIRKDA